MPDIPLMQEDANLDNGEVVEEEIKKGVKPGPMEVDRELKAETPVHDDASDSDEDFDNTETVSEWELEQKRLKVRE